MLRKTAQQSAIVYDATQKRGWMVPKLSLLHHMSHAYVLRYAKTGQDHGVPFAQPYSDAMEIVELLSDSSESLVYGKGGKDNDTLTLRQLMMGLNLNLLSTLDFIRNSSGRTLYGFEFSDVVSEPGRGSCMREITVLPRGKRWIDLANVVDAVVVCSEFGDAITPLDAGKDRDRIECNHLPKSRDYLAAMVPCLATIIERKGGRLTDLPVSARFRISEKSSWAPKGKPFGKCTHSGSTNENCWERTDIFQCIKKDGLSEMIVSRMGLFTQVSITVVRDIPDIPSHAAVIFGD